MYKIKLKEDKVIINYNLETGMYKQKTLYQINLTDKTHSYFNSEEELLLEWNEIKDDLEIIFEDLKAIVDDKIFNNKNVIYTAQCEKNDKGEEKAKIHLEKNLIIKEYLNTYTI